MSFKENGMSFHPEIPTSHQVPPEKHLTSLPSSLYVWISPSVVMFHVMFGQLSRVDLIVGESSSVIVGQEKDAVVPFKA